MDKNANKLTKKQQEVLNVLEKYDYNISFAQVADKVGTNQASLSVTIDRIEEKGYSIRDKVKARNSLTKKQQEVLNVLEEYDYNISFAQVADKIGTKQSSLSLMINRIEEKGYNIRNKVNPRKPLTKKEEQVLDILEKNNYNITYNQVANMIRVTEQNVSSITNQILKKFIQSTLRKQDYIKVAKFIINKIGIKKLLNKLKSTDNIAYDNISALIDELLKDQNKRKAVGFIIDYEKILLEKDITQVRKPLYKVLEYGLPLTKREGEGISEIMHTYVLKLKEIQNNMSNSIEEIKPDEECLEV